jgi:hypothetical protein
MRRGRYLLLFDLSGAAAPTAAELLLAQGIASGASTAARMGRSPNCSSSNAAAR